MPSKTTITKASTEKQVEALEAAAKIAGVTKAQAIEAALKAYCEAQGVTWPETATHGGMRPGGFIGKKKA